MGLKEKKASRKRGFLFLSSPVILFDIVTFLNTTLRRRYLSLIFRASVISN